MKSSKNIISIDSLKTTYSKFPKKHLHLLNHRKWFPFNYNSRLLDPSSFIIGKIMGDGNLDSKFTCRFVGEIDDLKKLKTLISSTYRIEKEKFSLYFRKNIGESHILQVNDSLFGRFFYVIGAPQGNKTKTEFYIPKWIYESKNTKKSFLQGVYEDELATIKLKREKYIREATFRMAKILSLQDSLQKFLMQVKEMTESFEVMCSNISKPYLENVKEGEDTYSQCFRILGNRANILKFSEEIGFKFNHKKINELERVIKYVDSVCS